MLQNFLDFLTQHKLLSTQKMCLLAVSGGVDSVVMGTLFAQAKLPFAIAHCNFTLRGDEADQDQALVAQMALQYNVPFYVRRFPTRSYAQHHGISIQMAARQLRRAWLERLCTQHDFGAVALAHHGDDCWETTLLNLTRGTGIMGLQGMQPSSGIWIRPLLFASKAMILAYALKRSLSWRQDASNAQVIYKRNLIRHQIVPPMKRLNPNLHVTSRHTTERLLQTASFFSEHVARISKQAVSVQGAYWHVSMAPFEKKRWAGAVLAEILRPWGFGFKEVQGLLRSKYVSGSWIESPRYRLYTDRKRWIIGHKPSQYLPIVRAITCQSHRVDVGPYTLACQSSIPMHTYRIATSKNRVGLDQDRLTFPLCVRRWKPGDRFCPLGMSAQKKISDFLIDLKVPLPQKPNVHVVETADAQIAWVIGYRLDERFKLTETTKRVYELRLTTEVGQS